MRGSRPVLRCCSNDGVNLSADLAFLGGLHSPSVYDSSLNVTG